MVTICYVLLEVQMSCDLIWMRCFKVHVYCRIQYHFCGSNSNLITKWTYKLQLNIHTITNIQKLLYELNNYKSSNNFLYDSCLLQPPHTLIPFVRFSHKVQVLHRWFIVNKILKNDFAGHTIHFWLYESLICSICIHGSEKNAKNHCCWRCND